MEQTIQAGTVTAICISEKGGIKDANRVGGGD